MVEGRVAVDKHSRTSQVKLSARVVKRFISSDWRFHFSSAAISGVKSWSREGIEDSCCRDKEVFILTAVPATKDRRSEMAATGTLDIKVKNSNLFQGQNKPLFDNPLNRKCALFHSWLNCVILNENIKSFIKLGFESTFNMQSWLNADAGSIKMQRGTAFFIVYS